MARRYGTLTVGGRVDGDFNQRGYGRGWGKNFGSVVMDEDDEFVCPDIFWNTYQEEEHGNLFIEHINSPLSSNSIVYFEDSVYVVCAQNNSIRTFDNIFSLFPDEEETIRFCIDDDPDFDSFPEGTITSIGSWDLGNNPAYGFNLENGTWSSSGYPIAFSQLEWRHWVNDATYTLGCYGSGTPLADALNDCIVLLGGIQKQLRYSAAYNSIGFWEPNITQIQFDSLPKSGSITFQARQYIPALDIFEEEEPEPEEPEIPDEGIDARKGIQIGSALTPSATGLPSAYADEFRGGVHQVPLNGRTEISSARRTQGMVVVEPNNAYILQGSAWESFLSWQMQFIPEWQEGEEVTRMYLVVNGGEIRSIPLSELANVMRNVPQFEV